MYKENKIVAAVVFVLFAAAGVAAFSFKSTAKIFPLFCCVLGMVCSAALFISVVTKEHKAKPVFQAKAVDAQTRKKMIIMVALIAAYVILISLIGWTISSLLFMLAVSLYMGVPGMSRKKIVLISIAVIVVYYLIFKSFMNINLPTGLLF